MTHDLFMCCTCLSPAIFTLKAQTPTGPQNQPNQQ